MLGTNPIRRQELRQDGALEIEKVFYTIQGEGPFTGHPAVFVRTSGCWLACHFCDTEFDTVNQLTDPKMLLLNVEAAARGRTNLVVLTGGDPLRQNIVPFCLAATNNGWHVQIETAGIQWVPGLEELLSKRLDLHGVSIVCSPKTGRVHEQVNANANAWKYIIDTRDEMHPQDLLPTTSTQHKPQINPPLRRSERINVILARPASLFYSKIYVQPCTVEGDEEQTAKNWELAKYIALTKGYRLSLQTHKLLGLE